MTLTNYLAKTVLNLKRASYFLIFMLCAINVSAQYTNIPVTGFNDDVVANGTGATNTVSTGTIPGVTYPAVGIDGVGYTFIDGTYKWYSGSTAPTCFLPASGVIPSALTSGLSYQLQNYTGFNSLSIASNTYTGSVLPTTGSISLATPSSYGVLKVLYETVQNTAGPTITATITFTDLSTQVISGNTFVNWFTATGVAYTPTISRAQNVAPGTPGGCTAGTGPFLFEMSLNISPANYGKQVQSVSFNFSAATGAAANTVDYLHVLALGGIAPCTAPADQPTVLNLTSPTGTTVAGNFTPATSAPSGYLTVIYPSGSTPTIPVSGTNYTAGNALGLGKIVSASATTTFSATGLFPGVAYDIYVYSYNSGTCATVYNTTAPLIASITTSGTGATLLISPYGDGGFETGTTLASNNWNVVNSAVNAWTVGTVPTGFTNRSAYISNNSGPAWAYTATSATASHIYKDITFPAGQSDITLSFNWKALGEASSWDAIIVYTCPTTITPLAGSPASTTGNVAAWTGGAPTAIGAQLWNQGTNLQTFSACLPASFAGTTQRIVITWKNDGTAGTSPPAAVDNVALVSAVPAAPANQATALSLTAISTSQINGSFTAATSAPAGYVVVRYPSGATTTNPATGTTYVVGNTIGSGTVVAVGTGLTFSATGLSGGTTYDFYVYDYSNSVCAGITYNTVSPLTGSLATNPCGTMTSPITVGPSGTYPTLSGAGGAIAAIQTNGISAPMVIELQSTYTAAGETYPIVMSYNACVTSTNTLTIRPEAATAAPLVISSANTTATIDMSGATNVTIDGRPGGTGTNKYLSIVNTSSTSAAAGNAILMRNDARSNTLTYLDLKGSNLNIANNTGTVTVGSVPGVVAILSTTGLLGNDNNTISFNDIHSVTSTGNLLNVGIYAYNATTVGSPANNDNNVITDNNIYDCFNATTATAAIDVLVGNNSYTITNNSFYKSPGTTFAYTAAVSHRGFWITPNGSTVASSGFNISNNFIGGTAPQCGGTPYTSTSTAANVFNGMDISVGTASNTSIQNNLITNFAATTASTSPTAWVGIGIAAGNIDMGTVTGNLIGSTSTNGAISFTTTLNLGGLVGIRVGTGGIVNIANNVVSGINIQGSAATVTAGFTGINCAGGTTINMTNNTIGSASLANSINAATATTSTSVQVIRGIWISGGTTPTATGNLIANMNSNITATSGNHSVAGITVTASAFTATNNIIRNLTSSSQSTSGGSAPSVIGITVTSTTAPAIIRGNTIHTLKNTASATTSGPVVAGIYYGGASGTTNLIEKNNIHSLVLTSNTVNSSAAISGMDIAGGQVTIRNNMIRLGYDENGNSIITPCLVRGISKNTNIANIYFNSVYIGGTGVLGTIAANTFAMQRTAAAATDDIRNNIFVNNRSNATTGGKHYQISLSSIATLTLNYNDYAGNGTGSVFALNVATDVAAYSTGWVAGDINSQVGDPQFINPTGNASTGDLHINPSVITPIEQQGQNIASVTEDIDGQLRVSTTPEDIGADAGNFTPVNPCSGIPATGVAAFTVTTAICGSGTKTMNLSGVTSQPGLTYQWQESTTGLAGSFVNVSTGTGGTTVSYTSGTLTSSSPLYFQCIVKCTSTGDSSISNTIQAIVNAAPSLTVTPATGTSVCSGSNVDLQASGAVTYAWTVNPGLTGYPLVSLLSTPANTSKVTSRPTSTLATSTANPPATSATPTWIYTVTGADASGCTSTASVTLNVITSAVVPLTLTYTYAPDPICEPGTAITFTVNNNGTIGSGSWVYNWYDAAGTTLLQTVTNTLATDTYTPATPITNGNKAYTVKVSNTACPASYAVASPSFFVGYTSLKVATNSNCGDNGQIAAYPEGQTDFTDWYVNNFTTGLLGPAFDASYGNTNFTGGVCNITPMALSQTGTFLVRNPASINTNNLQVDFKLSTAPRGFAFNILGADGMAWSYGPDVYQGLVNASTVGGEAESGSGTGFKLAFDATANTANNVPGVYLMYNCTVPNQGPGDPGVIAFKQGSFWQGLINAPVKILISENGFVTVTLNNQVIFDHIALPTAYLTANKSTWIHGFTARTGGSNELHAIDELSIRYNSYEYSINSTNGNDGSWQGSNIFTGLAAGTYPVWVRKLSDPTCFSNTGNAVISVDPSPSSATTVPSPGYSNVVCYNSSTSLTTNIYVPGATFLWEQASSLAGPWSPCPGTNNDGTYVTGGLTTNTYYRLTFTCPSSTPITSTPLLVTVNSGSIASTNTPVLVNCSGDNATVTAVPGPNTTCVWYDAPTGGTVLASGNSYTAVPASLPTTYYVEPVTTIYSNHYFNGGQTVIGNTLGTAGSSTGISTRFTTTASVIIDSIKVLPGATGTLVVALQNAGSATNISSFSFNVTAAMVGNFVNVPINLTVPGSGNYQLTTTGVACSYYSTYTGSYSVGYMTLGGVFSITGAALSATGAASTSYYGTAFRISISSSCPAGNGARVPVVVQANPATQVTTSVSSPTTCIGVIQTLSASSVATYSNYSWTPITDLYTDAAATIPYTAGANYSTVYMKATTSGTKVYTVSTVGSACLNTATATISVIASPNFSVTAAPTFVCTSGNVQLNANFNGTYCTAVYTTGTGLNDYITSVTLGTINNTTGASATPYNTYYSALNTNLTAGSTYTVTGTLNNGGTEDVAIWIDYNHDGTFSSTEKLGEQQTLTFSIPFTVPPGAYNGATRMRVRNVYATTNIDPCSSYTYGEVEDYNVTISGGLTPAGYTYDWSSNSTYLSATNIANPVATALSTPQVYSVQVTDGASGCSSTGSVSVAVHLPSSSSASFTSCGSYIWNGTTYTTSGVYTYTTLNAGGCDSIATLNLTINYATSSVTNFTTCGTYTWNGTTYSTSGTYTYNALNAAGCDSLATLNLTITPCNSILNLTCFIQGYFDGTGMLPVLANQFEPTTPTACDSIDVLLRDENSPYALVDSIRTVVNQNGTATCVFAPVSGNYYIEVKHRSAIQTWSANPIAMGATPATYNFTTASSQAYGDNMKEVAPGVWAFYSGDVVTDENMDLLDLGAVEIDITNFGSGYLATDINGDGNVDLLDSPPVEENISSFIFSSHP